MVGCYRKFIPHYSDICEPLYRLKKKGAKFNWSTEAKDSFDKIKRALTEAPVLQLPNFTVQFNLFANASGVGIGAVLNQNHRPIAFASRTLNKAERNYNVTERECLAVIWALNKFKTYFGSLPVKVRVYRSRQSDTISSDSHVETLYEGQRSSDRSSRSQPGNFKGSNKTSSEENKGRKSNRGNAGWEVPRLKRKLEDSASLMWLIRQSYAPDASVCDTLTHFPMMGSSELCPIFDQGLPAISPANIAGLNTTNT
ncbi:retrovirus-related Pol polyprotein from transposon 17.6 [Trichonephila clavipes]|nr:retrovirus-related Pol polyprotein from transposon 17.6 [Trichonephila clavipes]